MFLFPQTDNGNSTHTPSSEDYTQVQMMGLLPAMASCCPWWHCLAQAQVLNESLSMDLLSLSVPSCLPVMVHGERKSSECPRILEKPHLSVPAEGANVHLCHFQGDMSLFETQDGNQWTWELPWIGTGFQGSRCSG